MPDFLSFDFSFKTLAVAFFIVFAIKAFVKGVLRQVWGMVCLAAGAVAGILIFRNGSDWLSPVIEHPSGNEVLAASLLGGCSIWIGGKALVHKVYRGLSDTGSARSIKGRFVGAVLSLAPTCFLVWVIAVVLRLAGTLSEMHHIDSAVRAEGGSPAESPGLFAQLRSDLDQGWLGEFLRKTDPFTTEAGHQLASLLMIYNDPEAWARLKQSHPEIAKLLDNEKVKRVLDDKQVRNSVAFSEHASLLVEPDLIDAARDPGVARQLLFLNIQETAEDVLYEPEPAAAPAAREKRPGQRFLRRFSGRHRRL